MVARASAFLLAASTLALVAAAPAAAADLGGNCCADLEERIAELEATTARKGNRKVSLTVYGEVNQAVLWWDDGTESNTYVVSNATTDTKVGFEGRAAITGEWSAGYRLEIEISSADSDSIDQGNVPGVTGVNPLYRFRGDDGDSGVSVRHSNWWIESKSLGRFTVGQQSDAADGIAEIDLSGASAAGGSAVETWNERFVLRNKDTGVPLFLIFAGVENPFMINLFQGNLDGGRGNFVRYDSPIFAGFIFSASWGEVEDRAGLSDDDHDWSVALRYAGEFSGFQVAAGISYREGVTLDTDNFVLLDPAKTIAGSGSILHTATGLFATVAAGQRELAGVFDTTTYWYLKGGIYQRFNALGKTSIYGEYYNAQVDQVDSGLVVVTPFGPVLPASAYDEKAEMWGIGVVQHVDAAAMELYLSYRHYWADDITDFAFGDENDVEFDAVMSGARIKF